MDKKLKDHYKNVNEEIKKLEKSLESATMTVEKNKVKIDAEREYRYHIDMVHNFQHERFIHLIVTLFFGFLTLVSAVGFLCLSASATSYTLLIISTLAIFIILSITEIFYVAHYYKLENGTQKLYQLSERLEKIIKQ